MWIRASGKLGENTFQLTTAVSSHLLVCGEVAALVDASVAPLCARLDEEIQTYLKGEFPLRYIFLTHAHFDHLGAIPELRKRHPGVQLVVSPQSAEILSSREFLVEMFEQNKKIADALRSDIGIDLEEWCSAFTADRIVGDGDTISLGDGVEVKVVGLPGHTEDSLAYFILPDGVLCGSEALGVYYGREKLGGIYTSSYDQYIASIDKALRLDVKVLTLPHSGSLTGDLVITYLQSLRFQVEEFTNAIRERLAQGEIIEEIYNSVLPEWLEEDYTPEGPFVGLTRDSLRSMIRVIAEKSPKAKPA